MAGLAGAPLPATAAQASKLGLRLYDIRGFGAEGNGTALDSKAINAAIEACNKAGGGVVYAPPGTYRCGTVVLKSNVTLYLEAGAVILGSKEIGDYSLEPGPPQKGDANQKHLIFARDAENVGLAGPGRIDGQGSAYWVPSGRQVPPPEDGWRDVATYDWKPLDRPSPMLEFVGCRYLRIEDVRIENASGWTLRPINCDDVVIRGITIKNPVIGPNTDGIDATGCRNVFISDCHIDTGDDAICLKSENPYGGEPRTARNITITNCVLTCCCNGLKFGTATRGGFENITFSNCVIANEDVALNARVISGIALEMVDGGWLEGITISNVRMQRVRTPIFIRRGIRRARPDGTPGTLRGVMIENVHATGSILTSSITGIPGFNVEDVTLSGIRIDTEEAGKEEWVSREIPEVPKAYPEARMFGRLPSFGFYCRHVDGLRMRDIAISAPRGEARPTLVCDDVQGLELSGLETVAPSNSQPVVKLIQTRGAWLRGCSAPVGTKVFLRLEGERTERVALTGCNLSGATKAVETASNTSPSAVSLGANLGV
jgi:polygalacturonase